MFEVLRKFDLLSLHVTVLLGRRRGVVEGGVDGGEVPAEAKRRN
jgi:hypothetical protein